MLPVIRGGNTYLHVYTRKPDLWVMYMEQRYTMKAAATQGSYLHNLVVIL